MLTIGFLTHFDVRDGIPARFDLRDLRGSIVGRGIENRDGNHGGQAARYAACVEEIEPHLIAAGFSHIRLGVPRIYRGTDHD
jgi:hypothetical protein